MMGTSKIFGISATMAKDQRSPGYIFEGIVGTGSWNPNRGTIMVTECAGYTQPPDVSSSFLPIECTLLTPSVGQIGPPRGGEQVCFTECQSGWVAWFDNSFKQAIPALAGEWWQLHYDVNGNVDAYIKLTNDGPTPGDGLAGMRAIVGALLTMATTNGFTLSADDTNQLFQILSPGGLAVALDDTQGIAGVGDLPANMDSDQAAIRYNDLVAFAQNIMDWANNNFQAGTGSASDGPDVPDGSSTVYVRD